MNFYFHDSTPSQGCPGMSQSSQGGLWYKWRVKIKTLALQSTHTTFALLLSTSDRYGHYSHLTARSLD